MPNKGDITDLIDILRAFKTLQTIKKDTYAILQSAISELSTLQDGVLKNEIDSPRAFANANFIFLYALEKIPAVECVNINIPNQNNFDLELKTSEVDMSKLNKQIERIESKLHKANASGYKKLSEALNILLKDAIKWAKEFEHNRLSLEDAQSEISCLSLYAIDLTARGEEQCNLERVKGYLTQQ